MCSYEYEYSYEYIYFDWYPSVSNLHCFLLKRNYKDNTTVEKAVILTYST